MIKKILVVLGVVDMRQLLLSKYQKLYFSCGSNADIDTVKASILKDEVSYCTQCSGLVKPDIVFFGENLPIRFFTLQAQYIYYNSKLLKVAFFQKVRCVF